MTEVRDGNSLFAWLREAALIVAVVGAAWTIGGAIARVEVKVDHNADLLEHNAQAIERNAQALERIAQTIAELQASMAALSGRYEEHTCATSNWRVADVRHAFLLLRLPASQGTRRPHGWAA